MEYQMVSPRNPNVFVIKQRRRESYVSFPYVVERT